MKSDRRHELQKNELADRLASGIESTRSYLPAVLGGIGLLVVASIAWGIYGSYTKSQASAAWTEFYFNLTRGDADSFVDLAQDHAGSSAASWARQIAGDNYLQRGISTLYTNKADAKELIGKAIKAFEEVNQQTSNTDLRAKALLGLAQAHESLGEIDKATGYFQQLSKTTTQPLLVAEANKRLAFLTSSSGKEFYAWFSKLDPKPDAPITLPSDMMLPPTTPDLQFGPTDTSLNNSVLPAQAPVDTSSAPDLPAGGQVPAISTVPASDIPAAGDVPPASTTPSASASGTPPAAGVVPPVSEPPAAGDAPTQSPKNIGDGKAPGSSNSGLELEPTKPE